MNGSPPPPPPAHPSVKVAVRFALPEAWPPPSLDDGSKTYSRSEVLNIVSVVRAMLADDGQAREWAVAMLAEYDATKARQETDARIGR